MSRKYQFKQVDVFTKSPFSGNPLAVVFDADDLEVSEMQKITAWTNLSEAVFFLKKSDPKADYKIKIFSPTYELPFAGHPTLGAAYSAIESGIVDLDDIIENKNGTMIQECKIGLVELKVTRHSKIVDELKGLDISIAFKSPTPEFIEVSPASQLGFLKGFNLSESQGLKFLTVKIGITWCIAQFPNPELLLSIEPNMDQIKKMSIEENVDGITCFAFYPDSKSYEVRTFAPAADTPEDPVCGSGNAAVSCFMSHVLGLTGEFSGRQGKILGRDGQIGLTVTENSSNNYVAGKAITVVNGTIVA
ncbi:Yhi9 protein [Saccharomycopsis crataegensis]|uniref:Yhi9 protein n=1 Tax=Saccharomycopsis crataegensis TaxID=43959 RepID=A0AAV5QRX3_9ASCO|nr:Yhi9 protein [Saccharomycopsis crataegensis]